MPAYSTPSESGVRAAEMMEPPKSGFSWTSRPRSSDLVSCYAPSPIGHVVQVAGWLASFAWQTATSLIAEAEARLTWLHFKGSSAFHKPNASMLTIRCLKMRRRYAARKFSTYLGNNVRHLVVVKLEAARTIDRGPFPLALRISAPLHAELIAMSDELIGIVCITTARPGLPGPSS